MESLGVGIIGCGNISAAYAKLLPMFGPVRLAACADLHHAAAARLAAQHRLAALSVDDLLASEQVDIVLNLTVPGAHAEVSCAALRAGKHVYSEKPLALSVADGRKIAALAGERGLRVGGAADTFLGGSHQLARRLIDDGALGEVHAGTCHFLSPGMESWHPNPDFFFAPGGGPVFDMGAYYVGSLLNLVGPVQRVAALSVIARAQRTIGSGERAGERIAVQVPTTYHSLLELAGGAAVAFTAGWDAYGHRHPHMELYGTEAALFAADPNFFGGELTLVAPGGKQTAKRWDHPFGIDNFEHGDGHQSANYRGAGLADMAAAIINGGEHRCSLERCLHAVAVMNAIIEAAQSGAYVTVAEQCTKPEPLDPAQAKALLSN